MKALLLAAGEGTRLRPVTLTTPKCLVDIGGKPLLQHWLDGLTSARKFDEVIVNTHYLAERVESFLDACQVELKLTRSFEANLLGAGGTLLRHEAALVGSDFLVAHADNFSLIDWPEFLNAHETRPAGCVGTMMTFRTDDPRSCGIVELDTRGLVVQMHEKVENPPGNLANAAVFLFSPELFDIIRPLRGTAVVDISRDMIPLLLGRLLAFQTSGYHRDIGTVESLTIARLDFEKIQREQAE